MSITMNSAELEEQLEVLAVVLKRNRVNSHVYLFSTVSLQFQ